MDSPETLHPLAREALISKCLGSLIGSALGDAIGLYTEFLPKTACQTAYPSRNFSLLPESLTSFRDDSHRDKFKPGDWTDDTDQALLIVLSYLHTFNSEEKSAAGKQGEVDVHDIAVRINSWASQGLRALERPPLGIGHTIGQVVLNPEYLVDPTETAKKFWIKSKRNAAANGSLMRTHPLGLICVFKSEEDAFDLAARVGRLTHVDPRCVVSCCLQVGLVRGLLRGEIRNERDLDETIERAWMWINSKEAYLDPEHEDPIQNPPSSDNPTKSLLDQEEYRKYCYAKTLEELQLDDSQKMGYVYKCLATGIFCLRSVITQQIKSMERCGAELFEKLIVDLIMEGGDADTNACVAGALLGAWFGFDRLPPRWSEGLRERNWFVQKSQCVLYRMGIQEDPNGLWKRSCDAYDNDTAVDGGKGFLNKKELDERESEFVMMILLKQAERREEEKKRQKDMQGTTKKLLSLVKNLY